MREKEFPVVARAQSAGNAGERPATQTADAIGERGARARWLGGLSPFRWMQKRCFACWKRIWFWQARYTVHDYGYPQVTMVFHGECACEWLLDALNRSVRQERFVREVGWGK